MSKPSQRPLLALALVALVALPGCRGCGSESQRTAERAPQPRDLEERAAAEETSTEVEDVDNNTVGSLCYLLMHYGMVPVELATLSPEHVQCSALQGALDDWPCPELCATSRTLGPSTTLPRSLTWRLPEPTEQALALDPGAVRGEGRVLAELDARGAFVEPVYGPAAVAQALADDPQGRLAVALHPARAPRLVLELVPLAASGRRALELLTAPATELAESGVAASADRLALGGAIELVLTREQPDADDVLLVVTRHGVRLATVAGWHRFEAARCPEPTTLCLLPDMSDSEPWPLVEVFDQGGLDAALRALELTDTTRLWLWLDADVPGDVAVRALDVARHHWPQPPGTPWVVSDLAPERDTDHSPRLRFADASVYVHSPLPATPDEALPGADAAAEPAPTAAPGEFASFDASPGLDKAAIQPVVGAQVGAIDVCHAAHGGDRVELVVLRFTIGPDGQVLSASTEPTGQPAFEACVVEALEGMVFAPPQAGQRVEVRYPLAFGGHE